MKTRVALSLIFILAAGEVLVSCKRKELIQTQYTRLLNNWKLTRVATDGNANGAIDASEIQPIQEGLDDEIVFHGDSTGNETVIINNVTTTYPFIWHMDARDTIYRFGVGHDTIKYHLDEISSISLNLSTNSSLGLAAYYFERK